MACRSGNTDPGKALTAIQSAIRVDYLLGYVPSNTNWNGQYRELAVTVNRPGVMVIYRHGYHARQAERVWNDRDTMADIRLNDVHAGRTATTLTVKLTATRVTTDDGPAVDVRLAIEPSQIAFTREESRHVGSLDVAVWISDRQGNSVGTLADRIDFQLTDATYARLVKSDIVFARRIAVTHAPFQVRAGVYDYDNDRVGAISKRIQ